MRTVVGCTAGSHRNRSRQPGEKGGFKEAFEDTIQGEIEAFLGGKHVQELDFEALEAGLRSKVMRIAGRFLEQKLNADHSDFGGRQIPCSCHAVARYAGRREKAFTTVLGPLQLTRAYYQCETCGVGFCPRDRALGLEGASLSPGVLRMVGFVGGAVSFEEGSALLKELAGIGVSPKAVERAAEALGREIAQDEVQAIEADTEDELPKTLYLGMDGTGIPMRAEALKGRKGKQADGSAKTREVKLCTVWSAEGMDEKGVPVRDKGSITYTAAIESVAETADFRPSDFAARVLREASRRRFEEAKRCVILGDGAPWIWNLADSYFPGAIQIVDRFHVKEHLSNVAKAIWGASGETAQAWAKDRYEELDDENFKNLFLALEIHAKTVPEARQCLDYLKHNRNRIRYKTFRATGLCTSTGVVEAGCKHTIGTRLKRPGMHWTEAGANAIIALRCSRLSGRFESFWERRSQLQAAA